MSEQLYEVISLGARYWFALLGVLIVMRSFIWLFKDRRAKHERLRQLPDAGMIGELVVLEGTEDLPENTVLPVPREGILGFVRSCDIVVPCPGVARHHLDFTYHDKYGLLLYPRGHQTCEVNGMPMTRRDSAKAFAMHHGMQLRVGEALLRLRLFAGLDEEYHPDIRQDLPTPWTREPGQEEVDAP